MADRRATIGGQELELLRWIEARESASVGEAVEGFGAEHELARSTVLTMMERLRRKGHLARAVEDGVYRYRAAMGAGEAVRRTVADFVERTLSGSVTPFVAYLAEREDLGPEEVAELERLVARLGARGEGSER
ncbi:MAG: BlaI/MecI/CopY family transcriptional regulator [Thermoanaerobaculia bacterium]|nr:MAG: BlaI/MecI/CopY family transcriptional regulator [Thermoanaerobaculia bacterium]